MGTNERPRLRGTTWGLLALLTVGLALPLAAAMPAMGMTAPNPNNPPQQWAYGGSTGATATNTVSGWGPGGNWSYTTTAHGFLAWNVIFTQTNTSTTTFTLQEQRSLKAAVYVQATCSQGCGSSGASANLTATAWETDNAFANLTTQGTVYVNGTTPTQAVAVENAQSSVQGNATAVASWQTSSNSGNAYLSAAASAQAQVVFTPALGLFPMNPTPGMLWNASSTYAATGSYDVSCHYDYQGSLGLKAAGSCGASGSLSSSGPVSVSGADYGRVLVNGQTTERLAWGLKGAPFRFVDGGILVPASSDLLAGAGVGTTTSAGPAAASVGALGTTEVDYTSSGSHMGLLAAKSTLTSSAAGSVPVGSVSQASGAQGASSSPGVYAAQAQPETVSQAQSSDACIIQGHCGTATASPSGFLGLSLVMVAGLAVLAVIVVGLVVLWTRSPRRPTPPASSTSSSGPVGGTGSH